MAPMAAQLLEFVLLTALPGMLAWGPACDQIDDDVLGPQVAPYRFNAEKGAWKAEPLDAKAPEIERDTFTMVTWNIWFGDVQVMNRLEALANTIAALDPDFVALQEVTQPILHELLLRPWARYGRAARPGAPGERADALLVRACVLVLLLLVCVFARAASTTFRTQGGGHSAIMAACCCRALLFKRCLCTICPLGLIASLSVPCLT